MPKPDLVELTQQLIRFNTVNPPGREEDCAIFLAKLLESGGFEVNIEPFGVGRVNLIARLPGEVADAPALCFTGHLDTVPLGQAPWSRDAFGGEIADGKLYGRGSCDMKGGVAAMAMAALNLAAAGSRRSDLLLVLTGGEETGCEGARHYVKQVGGKKVGAIVVGEPTDNHPVVGHKGVLWLEATTHGVTAHGSMPEKGENAIYKAARAIQKLEKFEFEVGPHPLVGKPTFNLGTIQGGLNTNSVPDRTTMTIDIRTVPGQSHTATQSRLGRHLGKDVSLRPLFDLPGMLTEADNPWVGHVLDVVSDVTGEKQQASAATYFTDASVLTPALGNPPTVILGPGHPAMAHRTDEWCSVERLEQAKEIYIRLAADWCLPTGGGYTVPPVSNSTLSEE